MNTDTLKRIWYVGISEPSYHARNSVLLRGLRMHGVSITECIESSRGLKKFWRVARAYRAAPGGSQLVMVGYAAALYVPLMRLISTLRIVYNASNSMYEAIVDDRGAHARYAPAAWLVWCLDFAAFACAHIILVESEAQVEYLRRLFFIPRSKLKVFYLGADDSVFYPEAGILKNDTPTVAFRGGLLPATGVEWIVEAAALLKDEPIDFVVYGRGPEEKAIRGRVAALGVKRLKIITDFLAFDTMRRELCRAHLLLGQFSKNVRLERTIQNKVYEALALGVPLITRDSASNREVLKDGETCLFVPPEDAQALAAAIRRLLRDEALRASIGRQAYEAYERKFTPRILGLQCKTLLESALLHRK